MRWGNNHCLKVLQSEFIEDFDGIYNFMGEFNSVRSPWSPGHHEVVTYNSFMVELIQSLQ